MNAKLNTRLQSQIFDPIKFLGLDGLEEEEKQELGPRFKKAIDEYLLIKLLDLLPKDAEKKIDFAKIASWQELKSLFQKHIPDLERKIDLFLNNFKNDLKKEYYERK